MTVPSLPPEIWFRVSTLLDLPELSSMSQVNQSLNKIATDEAHFRRILDVPQPTRAIPSTTYRRLRACLYPPSSTVQKLAPLTDILCIVEDALILIHIGTARLISFPGAHTATLNDLVDRKCWKKGRVLPNEVRMRLAVLPGGHIAFLKGSDPIHLTVIHVKTWDMKKHVIPGERAGKSLLPGSHVFVAGNHGEWIIYHTDKETAALVDWRRATVTRVLKTIPKAITWKWLWGTCAATKVRSIVGVVHQENDGSKFVIRATGFDGLEVVFEHDKDRVLYSVLRSEDTSTHVVITRQGSSFGLLQFWAHRELSDPNAEQTWSGELVPLIYTKLIINGNVIEAIPQGYLGNKNFATADFSQHFVALEDDGLMESIWYPRPVLGSQMVWCKRTSESGVAVIGGRSQVRLVKLKKVEGSAKLHHWIYEDYNPEGTDLHSWSVAGLSNLCVLADHVIVAITADGKVESFHFDRFCRDEGVYACPWIWMLQSFRWPEESGVAEPDAPVRKRRRTARGAG